MQLVRERERIVAAARRLGSDGQVTGTAGNLSERAGELVAGCRALLQQGLGSDHGDFDLAAADALTNDSNKAVSR
ncbi:MAG TPA: hypothetical protein VGF91_25365 [Solirubrobacteraceae bacterium]|jgi:ribulose-5-phosphate 4-epimerase/fuculose-1-phosphate aldolase